MLPVIALVGRPNVGKSTLFNRLTGTRDALVADYPGLTRDRLHGFLRRDGVAAIVIDTGGITGDRDDLHARMNRQIGIAVDEADIVIMLVDAGTGVTPGDEYVAQLLRRSGRSVLLAVNKAEGRAAEEAVAEFFALGFGDPVAISAERGDRVGALIECALAQCPVAATGETAGAPAGTRIAVIGRPNVGKSTLINRYLGEERLVTQDRAGTTRDSVAIPLHLDNRDYTLVDTAGIRRRPRVTEKIEKFTIVKALQAIEDVDAVILLLDAREGVTEQDVSLIGLVLERGRALAIGINKWDGLSGEQRGVVRKALDRRLPFLDFVDMHFISALHGSVIHPLLKSAALAARAALRDLPTPRLNQVLREAVAAHPPPVVGRSRIKLSYAHQGGKRPPTIILHGNRTGRLPTAYRRFLVNRFRHAFRLRGTPVKLELRTGENPFAGRRNRLTPRQARRRRRVRKHRGHA